MKRGGKRSGAGRKKKDSIAVLLKLSPQTNEQLTKLSVKTGVTKSDVADFILGKHC